jgi:hypothetical protein
LENLNSKEYRIYFLSTGRVGTKFLYNLFKEKYPEIKLGHQSHWSRFFNIIGNFPLKKHHFSLISFLFSFLRKQKIPSSTIDPLLTMSLYVYLHNNQAMENTDIVHLIRDPRDFVSSFINWKNQSYKRYILHHMIPFWQPNPFFHDNYSLMQWLRMSKFEHFCWIWNYKNNLLMNIFGNNSSYHRFRMEDLTDKDNGQKELKRLFNLLGLPIKNENIQYQVTEKINRSTIQKFPKWQNWPNEKARILHMHCGSLMQKFNYGNEKLWLEKLF